jgi:hypothetical protein
MRKQPIGDRLSAVCDGAQHLINAGPLLAASPQLTRARHMGDASDLDPGAEMLAHLAHPGCFNILRLELC